MKKAAAGCHYLILPPNSQYAIYNPVDFGFYHPHFPGPEDQ
jgi:hypothetical protein